MEEILRAVPGVLDTDVGYTGGWLANPTYDDTHESKSGHAEAVRITFDPSVLSYEDLLEQWFFRLHDPPPSTARGTTSARSTARRSFRSRPSSGRRGRAGEGARRGVGQVEAADHDLDRARGHVVQRGGVPPGLPAEASRRVQLPLHAGLGGPGVDASRLSTAYISSSGRTSDSHSNDGQCTRCSSMNSVANFSASSLEATSTSA